MERIEIKPYRTFYFIPWEVILYQQAFLFLAQYPKPGKSLEFSLIFYQRNRAPVFKNDFRSKGSILNNRELFPSGQAARCWILW